MRALAPGPAYLFCPADRPDRYAKAASAADVVILDLEDAVAAEAKEQARNWVRQSTLDPVRTVVRVNSVTSEHFDDDVAMLRESTFRTVMLAKTASAEHVRELADFKVVALIETAAGVLAAEAIAACPNTLGLMWGSEDLVATLGGTSSHFGDGSYRDVARHARAHTLICAGAYERLAIDAVCLEIADVEAQRARAQDASAMGFSASACIHPNQVAVIRESYRPTADQLAWAQSVVDAAQGRAGVFRLGTLMVDGPVIAQAQAILNRAIQ